MEVYKGKPDYKAYILQRTANFHGGLPYTAVRKRLTLTVSSHGWQRPVSRHSTAKFKAHLQKQPQFMVHVQRFLARQW